MKKGSGIVVETSGEGDVVKLPCLKGVSKSG
jgi:hypothetical protein